MTARIYALCNQKGGVGKTTMTFHLARAAVRAGLRVLMVDADPQGNLTTIAGVDVSPDQVGLADVLSTRAPETLADVIVPTSWEGAHLVPTPDPDTLAAVGDELVIAGPGREGRLRAALADVAEDYDVVFIDCPPSLGLLFVNCLTAAKKAGIVTHTGLFSVNGIAQLLKTILAVQTYYNAALVIAGILVNHHEARTISGQTWLANLEEAAAAQVDDEGNPAPLTVLRPSIPKAVVIKDSSEAGRGLDEWPNHTNPSVEAMGLLGLFTAHLATLEGTTP
jgi:chromosome partitioning protein